MGGVCGKSVKKEETKKADKSSNDFSVKHSELIRFKEYSVRSEYKLSDKLYNDKFASIYICRSRSTNLRYIAKVYQIGTMDSNILDAFLKEVMILRSADHPNIIKVIDIFQDSVEAVLVTEMCNGGELFDRINKQGGLTQNEIAGYIEEIASALSYLHSKNIVHRDLRPEILMLVSEEKDSLLKIVDFGSAKYFEKNLHMLERVGSPYFMAPEVIMGNYTSKCDIWSLGVLLYVMLTGSAPFQGTTEADILDNVLASELSFDGKTWKKISQDAKDLLKKMLNRNAEERPTANEVMNDPWIRRRLDDMSGDNVIMSSTLKKLSRFNAENKLYRAILAFIISQLITSDEVGALGKVFKQIDKNGDGILSKEEIKEALEEHTTFAEHDIDNLIAKVDLDNDQKINYSEFLAATIDWEDKMSRERLESTFKALDTDKSGKISKEELMAALGGSNKNMRIFEEMISEADANGDGEIDIEEFCNYMGKLKKKGHKKVKEVENNRV